MTTGSTLDRVVAAAGGIAAKHRHAFIGTEHLLAALLSDRDGFSATLLSKAGLDLARVSDGVLQGLKATPGDDPPAEPTISRFAERAIEAATQHAKAAGRPEAEERDLLRQLIAQPKGRMAQVLKGDGKALPALRAALGDGREVPDQRESPERQDSREGRERKVERRGTKIEGAGPKPESRTGRGGGAESTKRSGPERGTMPASRRPTPDSPPPAPRSEPVDGRPTTPRRIAQPLPPRRFSWFLLLLIAVPASFVVNLMHASPVLIFVIACLGVLPLAKLMGDATESLADRTGPTIGGLLNATFGNAAELIIALVALRAGLIDLVKASITGSILGNLLLILGLSFVAAGTKTDIVRFNRTNAGMSAAMLALAVIGLVFPAVFHAVHGPPNATAELYLSEAVSIVLIATYGLSLLFSLKTHRALFGGGAHPSVTPKWGVGLSIGILAAATAGIVVESEILVHSVEAVTATLGLTETFLGLVIIPLIGNAAEHATAIVVARKGQMDLALQIALGSSTQVALLIAPILVFAGVFLAAPMNLVFPLFEVAAVAVSTIVIAIITLDGESHWFEGVQLLAVYAMMAAAAFFI